MESRTEHDADDDQRAGRDLHLAHQFQRLALVDGDGQAGRLPGLDAAFENIGLAGTRSGQPRRIGLGAHAGLAVIDDNIGIAGGRAGAERRQGLVAGARDVFAGELVGVAHIDDDSAARGKGLGFFGGQCLEAHDLSPLRRGKRGGAHQAQ